MPAVWPAIACVFAFAVSGLYTFSGAVAGSFGHNILWLVIFSVTDPTALILVMSVLTEEICLQMPCVATFTKPAFDPRFPTIKRKMAANRVQIPALTPEGLTDIDAARIGLKGSPTRVKKSFVPVRKSGGMVISEETVEESAAVHRQQLRGAEPGLDAAEVQHRAAHG